MKTKALVTWTAIALVLLAASAAAQSAAEGDTKAATPAPAPTTTTTTTTTTPAPSAAEGDAKTPAPAPAPAATTTTTTTTTAPAPSAAEGDAKAPAPAPTPTTTTTTTTAPPAPAEIIAKDYRLDAGTLAKFSPRARADLIATMLEQWKLAEDAGISSAVRVTHFMAQMATETGGMVTISENLNYSAERLRQIFPSRVTAQQARNLAGKPVAIANHVYGKRLGNRLANDGWDYRGSGLIQLTGRGNFSERGKELKLPFEENPEMVRTTVPAFQAAVQYWTARHINAIADTGDLRAVRKAVNGGTHGLDQAGMWLAKARRVLTVADARARAGDAEESIAIEQTLRSLGFLRAPKSGERSAPGDVDSSVKKFQRSRGLPETGKVDEDTFYELTNPDNFRKDGR